MTDVYDTWLTAKAREWAKANPDTYATIRALVLNRWARAGNQEPAKGSLAYRVIASATVEEIRKQNQWPSEREHEAGRRLTNG